MKTWRYERRGRLFSPDKMSRKRFVAMWCLNRRKEHQQYYPGRLRWECG